MSVCRPVMQSGSGRTGTSTRGEERSTRNVLLLLLSLLFSVPVLTTGAAAQTIARLGVEFTYDGNAYRTADPVSDYVTRTSLYLARDLDRGLLSARVFYGADIDLSARETDRRSHDHRVGLSASRALGDDGGLVNVGGALSISRHAGDLDLTDFVEGTGFFSVRLPSGETRIYQLGGRLGHRSYAELPEFTNTEGLFYGRLSLFHASKTSIILSGSLGLKGYATGGTTGDSSGGGSHGHGRGMGSGGGGTSSGEGSSLVDQVIGSVTVGRSLTSSTGLSLSYLRRFSLSGDAYPVYPIGGIWYEAPDDELFNDPYSYEGHDVSAVITRLLPLNSSTRLGYEFSVRDYRYDALDIDGEPLPDPEKRADRRHLAWLNFGKTFTTGSVPGDIRLFFEFTWIDNGSNDPYFDYTDRVYSFGTSLTF